MVRYSKGPSGTGTSDNILPFPSLRTFSRLGPICQGPGELEVEETELKVEDSKEADHVAENRDRGELKSPLTTFGPEIERYNPGSTAGQRKPIGYS